MKVNIQTTQGVMELEDFVSDGIDHYNVYSGSHCEIGRWLSNFAPTKFTHPVHGEFLNMESYWHWVATGMQHHQIKMMSPAFAKSQKRKFPKVPNPNFETFILEGLHLKLTQHPKIYSELMETDPNIPFAHYYVYNNTFMDVFAPSAFWLMELEQIRQGKELITDFMTPNTI